MNQGEASPDRDTAVVRSVRATSTQPAAVTTHFLATQAAHDVMAAGGNAVDAAVAANAVLGVVLPDTCGPGGDLFALVHLPGEHVPFALNASGKAGSRAHAALLRDAGHTEIPMRSPWSVTVPGCVDGWEALVGRFGTESLARVLEPAIAAASEGFPVSEELSDSLRRLHSGIGHQPSAAALYPGGAAPQAGATLTRLDLAATLRDVAQGGRTAFYEGRVGAGITAATEGIVTPDDLAAVQADWIEPLHLEVFDVNGWTIPPNSQGYLALAGCWIAAELLEGLDPRDPGYHHALIEAYRSVAWERDDLVSDPQTAPQAAAALVDPVRLAERTAAISPDTVAVWPQMGRAPGGTMYLCTRDRTGLAVSLIQSNFHGIGSRLGAGDTGVFLHDRGAGFTLRPGHPNELAPGKRPLHTLAPTLWTDGGDLRLVLGTRGGQYQPQLLIQLAAHHLAAGVPLAEAMALPRWTVDHWGRRKRHVVLVEPEMPETVLNGLRRCGHRVERVQGTQAGWGPMAAIATTTAGVEAAADPRVSTSSAWVG